MLPQTQNSSAIYNGKIVDTWAKLPQAHMYMESEYILIVLEMCAHLSKITMMRWMTCDQRNVPLYHN
jgi:hypothetical protein